MFNLFTIYNLFYVNLANFVNPVKNIFRGKSISIGRPNTALIDHGILFGFNLAVVP
jgi:hypothetical protein